MTSVIVFFAVAIITAIAALYVKQIRPDFALCITLAGALIIMWGVVPRINLLISDIKTFSNTSSISGEYILSVIKIIGITYLAEFSADICIDAGERTLAKHVETIGKLTVAFIALPIVEDVFSLIISLLE